MFNPWFSDVTDRPDRFFVLYDSFIYLLAKNDSGVYGCAGHDRYSLLTLIRGNVFVSGFDTLTNTRFPHFALIHSLANNSNSVVHFLSFL